MQNRNTLVMSHQAAAAIGLDVDAPMIFNPDIVVFNRCYDALAIVEDELDLEAVLDCRDLLGDLTFVGLFGLDDIISWWTALCRTRLPSTLGYVEDDGYGRFFRCYAFKV